MLVAYTDGVVEPENPYGEQFGEDRLKDLLVKHGGEDSAEIIARVDGGRGRMDHFVGIAGRYDHAGGAADYESSDRGRKCARWIAARSNWAFPGIVLMENAGHRVVEFLAGEVRAARVAADRRAVRQGQQRRRWPGGGAAIIHTMSTRPRSTWCCTRSPRK